MGINNVIRGVGSGVASIGRAVTAASKKLDEAVAPRAATSEPAPQVAQAPADVPGFKLPDLGPKPDQTAEMYKGEGGPEQYQVDAADWQHRSDIHDAFNQLESIYTAAHPNRNFQQEYLDLVAQQKAGEAALPKENPLIKGALTVGDMNPAVRTSNAESYSRQVAGSEANDRNSLATRMQLRMKMHEQAATDAEAQGNWKKALAENEALSLLQADTAKMNAAVMSQRTSTIQQGLNTRAALKRDEAEKVANIRARAIGAAHGLSGGFLAAFNKYAAQNLAKFLGPQDIMKDYSTDDLDQYTQILSEVAQKLEEQQGGQQKPSQRPAAAPAPNKKEQF